MKISLEPLEQERYQRQLALDDFSSKDQVLLKDSKVLIVGAGGLGSPIIAYLAAAGVGELRIADEDSVSLSNLQRQVLFREEDLGKNKAAIAVREAKRLNSKIAAIPIVQRIAPENVASYAEGCDLLIDACDNYTTRYLLDETSALLQIPYLYGAVEYYVGQIALFRYRDSKVGYRDLFPRPDMDKEKLAIPVLGAVAGTVGCMIATEAIKALLHRETAISKALMLYDAKEPSIQLLRFPYE